MSFENRNRPLLTKKDFYIRVLRYTGFSFVLILASLIIGVLGYHYLNDLDWLDALVNASMILTGMGPVDPLKNEWLNGLLRSMPFSAGWHF